MKGGGARSVFKSLKRKYQDVSERGVLKVLQKSRNVGETQAKFTNKPPMRTVLASFIFEGVQIDLMKMQEVVSNGKIYRYVLSVVDVFSRNLFCRALMNKSTDNVATELKNIFIENVWPKILQRDNGPELLWPVTELFRKKKVKVVKGCPYHPQSQGKIERQNSILRTKLKYDMMQSGHHGQNWVERLSKIFSSINKQPEEVLDYASPFLSFLQEQTTVCPALIHYEKELLWLLNKHGYVHIVCT